MIVIKDVRNVIMKVMMMMMIMRTQHPNFCKKVIEIKEKEYLMALKPHVGTEAA